MIVAAVAVEAWADEEGRGSKWLRAVEARWRVYCVENSVEGHRLDTIGLGPVTGDVTPNIFGATETGNQR